MPCRFVYVVRALSPRDGGWVRWTGHWKDEEAAWTFVTLTWPLLVLADDYVTVEVVKTIAFSQVDTPGFLRRLPG